MGIGAFIAGILLFVSQAWQPEYQHGLSGRNIAVWRSHGLYYDKGPDMWQWQRPRLFNTCEDLFTGSFTEPFLIPMLENAGAYVLTPRERDTSPFEIIIDHDGRYAYPNGYVERNRKRKWTDGGIGFAYNDTILHDYDNPFVNGRGRLVKTVDKKKEESTAEYWAEIPETGEYAIYVSYLDNQDAVAGVPYTVHSAAGDRVVTVDQRMGASTWIYIGTFPLPQGRSRVLTISNVVPGKRGVITTDAVKIGGGIGNVARGYSERVTSGVPRWMEGARYWLQWAGMPDSVYSTTDYENDYTDDYRSRGLWVNYLSGGSKVNPKEKGLGIPIDLAFAFHTDAGIAADDSIVGTLAIYSTDKGKPLGNGRSRRTVKRYAELVQSQVVEDICTLLEPEWTQRELRNALYAEARSPHVPAMILELLSHQNLADMRYGRDPVFRFIVARAVYKGILKYLSEINGFRYVVQPLPVKNFGITKNASSKPTFLLKWSERSDRLEPTAFATGFTVEMSVNGGVFRKVAETSDNFWHFDEASPDSIYSFRVMAFNDGGRSFPSETLSCGYTGRNQKWVNVVNGFTWVGAPESFSTMTADSMIYAGFLNDVDYGMPYIRDFSYTGAQFDFDMESVWMDNELPGFGASRADYEGKMIAGNTFNYPYIHGQSIVAAGFSFVSQSEGAFTGIPDAADNYVALDLILGNQKEWQSKSAKVHYQVYSADLQNSIEKYAAAGVDIFISGSNVATGLWKTLNADSLNVAAITFGRRILGMEWRTNRASIAGEVYQVPTPFPQFTGGRYSFKTIPNNECYAVQLPDSFTPSGIGEDCVLMRYADNKMAAATAMHRDGYSTVVMGFPFEVIEGRDNRDLLMKQILDFFDR